MSRRTRTLLAVLAPVLAAAVVTAPDMAGQGTAPDGPVMCCPA